MIKYFILGAILLFVFFYMFYYLSLLKVRNNKKALRRWARRVVTKNSRCYICKTKSNLQAHHNFDKTTFPFFAFSEWNGVPMCALHHADYHEWRGGYQKYCTPLHLWIYKQLRRFVKAKKIAKLKFPKIIIKWM